MPVLLKHSVPSVVMLDGIEMRLKLQQSLKNDEGSSFEQKMSFSNVNVSKLLFMKHPNPDFLMLLVNVNSLTFRMPLKT